MTFVMHVDSKNGEKESEIAAQHAKFVRVFAGFGVENALLVYLVHSHLAGGMYDLVVGHDDAHMHYGAFVVVEKGQIAGQTFFNKTKCFAQQRLIAGVAWQSLAHELEYHLHPKGLRPPHR
jgi:hypothetical protein